VSFSGGWANIYQFVLRGDGRFAAVAVPLGTGSKKSGLANGGARMLAVVHGVAGWIGALTSVALALGLASEIASEHWSGVPDGAEQVKPQGQASATNDALPGVENATRRVAPPARRASDRQAPGTQPAGPVTLQRVYRITAYCDRGITASGIASGVGQCAAPIGIPFGARVIIPALGRSFVVTDRTHPRFRHNTVDIFVPSAALCRDFGRRYLQCEIVLPAGHTESPGRG
jgi:3D (Asp-Asp-Asp) domain-containing protein